jgi:hypothetical protein
VIDPATLNAAVREALRRQLASRGYTVSSDSVSLRKELYVRGQGDSAAAIFEFKADAAEAAETMYQGRWTADLPPRFAVLPAAEADAPDADFLQQAGFSVLFFEEGQQDILFVEFERALDKIGRPATAAAT